ncbi:hypothetical protein BSKO_13830 [Bryopsis sp. KO-2023]|nr:hypothetical protein BSKO_13830 [Bryopsis sp. KO-2023]
MDRKGFLSFCLIAAFFVVQASADNFWGKVRGPGALVPRTNAPEFSANAVVDEEFKLISLSDFQGKWLVLLFYPFDFTFVCPTELVAYSEAVSKYKAAGAEIAAVSTDSHHTHLAWVRTARDQGGLGGIKFPLIADISKKISFDYGVLVEDENDPLYGAALRGIFIIDPTGKIRATQVNDESVGRNVDETLRLLQAFQYADEHGEGCPANWHPGDKTIKPHPDKSKAFFATWSTEHES